MRIYFYPECNFNINKAKTYDVTSLAEWFDSQHKNPDDYEIVGKDGESHDSAYEADVCAVYPRIMGGKSKGKNILKVVVGLALVLATGGTTAALFAHYGGINMAHALGAGLLLSGGGALLMGKMKMPSMDLSSDSATKENYQWNVGNLSTSRGVKGVTFGSNVIPEGELLAYRTYGTNSIEKVVRSSKAAGWYYQGDYNKTYAKKISGTMGNYYKWLPGYTEYASVSTDSSSYLEMLIGCGEGELDSITDIKINDISVSDLEMVQDVDYAIRLGSNTQTALKQTNLDSQAGYQSIGQAVPVKLNGSVTPLLVTTPSACDSCCIAFQVPNWYMYDTSSGAKNSAFIKLKIGYRTSGSSGSYTYLTKTGITEIDNATALKSESAFYFQVVIKFPSNGTYQISIENDSAELNNTKGLLSNAEYSGSALPDRAAINMSVDNIACYNNKEQTYPNTALIWLRIPASQTLNGSMPKVTWKQTRASIYAYNGSSYVTKPADNLAWAIYDIIAQVRKDGNTYHNEGEDVANIDFDKFVAFASFCESIGAKGNWFLNKLDTSWSNAMSVATSCRAFIGLRSGKVCPYWDAPTEMTQIFTVGNYEDMSGVITAKKDRAKAIEATFNNEEEKYASRTVRVEIDNDHSAEAVSMTFVGLSNPVNVSKQAHYILRRNKYLVQSIKFTADIDSIVCELNDVIGIQCDLTEYGVGGRIFKVENNVISLDAPVTLTSGNSYALLVRHTDGTLERKTPVETNGTFTQLTFSSAWSKPVLKGDVYSFGIANSEVRKYRVTGITRTNDLKAQIEAIEYNENVYDELAVAPYTYTNPNAGINNVTTTYTPEAVELAWDANNNTSYVNVYVDGVFYGRYQNGAQIPNINSEQLVEMFPVNEYGEEDTPVVRTISNNLPTPSTPPVPIVQSTTTGCVAEFDGIPKDENIVWLIIKEGDNELGRVNILGEYMSVSIQLKSGTHTLSAYFVNQFSKSSQARTFTATPLGDIQANDISATALKLPTGSILRLSAKNCHGAEDTGNEYPNHISDANGVKDCSGRGNHGQAYGGVSVVQDAEMGDCFSFDGTEKSIRLNSSILGLFSGLKGLTISFSVIFASIGSTFNMVSATYSSSSSTMAAFVIRTDGDSNKILIGGRRTTNDSFANILSNTIIETNKKYTVTAVFDYENAKAKIFVDGQLDTESDYQTTGTFDIALYKLWVGKHPNSSANTYNFNGLIADVRIYPRALSASEIKTIYMFPDDVTFGQMTADLIGANVIKGTNLYSENIITQAAQINQAVFQSLIVTNGSTVANQVDVGGRNLAKSTSETEIVMKSDGSSSVGTLKVYTLSLTLTQGKQYTVSLYAKCSNTTDIFYISLAQGTSSRQYFVQNKKLTTSYQKLEFTITKGSDSVNNILITNYKSYGGQSANTGTLYFKDVKLEEGNKATTWTPAPEDTDASINAITTNIYSPNTTTINGGKITTGTIQAAAIAANSITAQKLTVSSFKGLPIADIQLIFNGLTTESLKSSVPDVSGNGNSMIGYGSGLNITRDGVHRVTFNGTDDRFSMNLSGSVVDSTNCMVLVDFILRSAPSTSSYLVCLGNGSGQSGTKIGIMIESNREIRPVMNGAKSTTGLILSLNTRYRILITFGSGTIGLMINGEERWTGSATTTTFNTNTLCIGARCGSNISTGAYFTSIILYEFRFWFNTNIGGLTTTAEMVKADYNIGVDPEAGQITADRIATDAIRGRNASGGGDGSYTTQGLVMSLAGNGWLSAKNFYLKSDGSANFKGNVQANSGNIGAYTISQQGIYYESESTNYRTRTEIFGDVINLASYAKTSGSLTTTLSLQSDLLYFTGKTTIDIEPRRNGASYSAAPIIITPEATGCYGIYVKGYIRANSTDYSSDEKTKKDFQDVDVLDKLKALNVCAWRFDEEKLIEKDNAFIDEENIKIEAENKAIDAENAEIVKENELRKNRKDGEPVELLPLKERKKLREHRIADKNANHPLNIGCMAGEFNKAFGTNNGSEDCLSVTDTIGVCMRAIQELAEISDAQKSEIAELKALLKIQQDEKSDVEQEIQQEEQKK